MLEILSDCFAFVAGDREIVFENRWRLIHSSNGTESQQNEKLSQMPPRMCAFSIDHKDAGPVGGSSDVFKKNQNQRDRLHWTRSCVFGKQFNQFAVQMCRLNLS